MLLRGSPQASVVLFDFLVPSLCRAPNTSSYSTSSRTRLPSRSHIPYANAPRLNYDPTKDINPKAFDHLNKTLKRNAQLKRHVSEPENKADLYNSISFRFSRALRDKNAVAALKHWQELAKNDFIPLITAHDLKRMSQLVVSSSLIPPPGSQLPLVHGVEDVAIVTATSRFTEGLVAVMVFHIKRNDPDAVLSLYERFKTMMIEKGVWENVAEEEEEEQEEEEETEEPEDEALAWVDNSPASRYCYPGYTKILLAATTAHAMRNDLPGAVAKCLETRIRFQYSTNAEFLSNLDDDPILQEKVRIYIRRLDVAKLLSRPPSFSKHVMKLGAGRSWKLSRLYATVIEGISGPDPFIAADPKLKTSRKLVSMTTVGFTSFLTAFRLCDSQALARSLWETIPSLGITHDISMWNALIDASAQKGSFSEALGTWDLMASEGVEPDALSHRAMIAAYFNGKRPHLAMEQFREFRSQCAKTRFPPEDVMSVHNTVLSGLLNTNRPEQANAFLEMMEKGQPKPDVVSYNTFLGHFTRQNDLRRVTNIMDKMSARGITGDTFTYSTILSALLRVGRADATDLVLDIMEKQGIEPSVATYTAIISSQMRDGNEEHLKGALTLLKKMEGDKRLQPNASTYIILLQGVHRGNFLTPHKVEQFTDFIMKRMEQRKVTLGTGEYTALIREWLYGDHPKGVQKALQVYQGMGKRNITLSYRTWDVLLSGLVRSGEWARAEEVVTDMLNRLGEPPGTLMALVDQVRWRRRERRHKRYMVK